MKFATFAPLLLSINCAAARIIPSHDEQLFLNEKSATREKVAGDNPAYYIGPPKNEQLFAIKEFTTSPNPPTTDKHTFFFLSGFIPHRMDSLSLRASTINLTIQHSSKPDSKPFSVSTELRDFPPVMVRRITGDAEVQYGGHLRAGENELLADMRIPSRLVEAGNYTVTVEARMGCGRVLFSMEADIWLEGTFNKKY